MMMTTDDGYCYWGGAVGWVEVVVLISGGGSIFSDGFNLCSQTIHK